MGKLEYLDSKFRKLLTKSFSLVNPMFHWFDVFMASQISWLVCTWIFIFRFDIYFELSTSAILSSRPDVLSFTRPTLLARLSSEIFVRLPMFHAFYLFDSSPEILLIKFYFHTVTVFVVSFHCWCFLVSIPTFIRILLGSLDILTVVASEGLVLWISEVVFLRDSAGFWNRFVLVLLFVLRDLGLGLGSDSWYGYLVLHLLNGCLAPCLLLL